MPPSLANSIRGQLYGNVTAQVGPVFTLNKGFTGVVRNGAGDYTLTLQDGLAIATEGAIAIQPISALFVAASVELVTAATIRVRTFDAAGAALESNFSVMIQDVGPQ